ncbi:MAG: aminotransferase [Rhodospirillaceae bacterium]
MKPTNSVLSGLPTTVFTVMSALATEHNALNLGQGFSDDNGPDDVRAKAAEAMEKSNQYPPMMGLAELRKAVAANGKRYFNVDVDWTEVMVTSGGTESLAACLLGLIEPGDEVIVFEPFYDSYLPMIRRAGGIPKIVRLMPPLWELPREELAAAFSPRTKLMILNTPMNPCSKVFRRDELDFIADLAQKNDIYVICDEVYDHLVYDGQRHISLITLPGMHERCLRLGSAGKTFSLTGWKVGYVSACPALLGPVSKAHQFLTFTTPPNLQWAVAYGLEKDDAYFYGYRDSLQRRRDMLARGLSDIGFKVLPSQGTIFVTADFANFGFKGDDVAFCHDMTVKAGVTAIPVSAFYEGKGPDHFVRFAFCKKESYLEAALERLAKYYKR